MADLGDIPPEKIPSVSDDDQPTDVPVADPDAVAQEDEDTPPTAGVGDEDDADRGDAAP